ncbi:MAG TPA: multifunctional CCA addition/repair protein [Burkholderiaceae bacterium]|nr:multifunctional CCA addition/repair protein [Burkholderiaceae bacterium]
MQVYEVGGAVRDRLLGRPVQDRDWVVVGASPGELLEAGYTPVGRDFPVFLHPATREEYALARTERKTGRGYHGFAFHAGPEVTLEQDLARRDLTINAMALAPDGRLIDPWGGARDLRARVLRHVSDAFVEDPVRILRLARFAARFDDFTVAPETLALAGRMVAAGEVDALVPERVWQELSRGLMQARPSLMFQVLRACGALARLLPELDGLWAEPLPAGHGADQSAGVRIMAVLDRAAGRDMPLSVRFACLTHGLGQQRGQGMLRELCQRLRIPGDCRELAEMVAAEHGAVRASAGLDAAAVLRLLERCDALRKPQRFELALQACECIALGPGDAPYAPRSRLLGALAVAQGVDTAAVAAQAQARGLQGAQIAGCIHAARIDALLAGLSG